MARKTGLIKKKTFENQFQGTWYCSEIKLFSNTCNIFCQLSRYAHYPAPNAVMLCGSYTEVSLRSKDQTLWQNMFLKIVCRAAFLDCVWLCLLFNGYVIVWPGWRSELKNCSKGQDEKYSACFRDTSFLWEFQKELSGICDLWTLVKLWVQ